eukprot:PLAT6753.1.p1 GENE.PLAT6753.1~~PLAT6753.1.p1  ORF type:complete len:504 (-),score=221.68 PLAT6753.1:411-1832(-)
MDILDSDRRKVEGAGMLSVPEAEKFVEELRQFELWQLGSPEWMRQHERLEKLNLQAHHSAMASSDEFVLEAFLTWEKLELVVEELLTVEAWRAYAFPKLAPAIAAHASMRGYFVLYHEATVVNLLEILMFHSHARSAAGSDALMELVDYCVRKLVWLNKRSALEEEEEEDGEDDDEDDDDGDAVARAKRELLKRTPEKDLQRQASEIQFNTAVVAVALLRFLTENVDELPVSVITRLVETHDVLMLLVPLVENPPWTRRSERGWEKFVDMKWQAVQPKDLLKLTKLEGQVWLSLFNLLCSAEVRRRYGFHSFRKDNVLRLRKYMNDVLLDQLPVLADVHRFVEELSIMDAPPASSSSTFVVEQVPIMWDRLVHADWDAVVDRASTSVFAPPADGKRTVGADLRSLADLYHADGFEELLGDAKCGACGKPAPQRCSRCKNAWYCSRECQVGDWKKHKPLCDIIKEGVKAVAERE